MLVLAVGRMVLLLAGFDTICVVLSLPTCLLTLGMHVAYLCQLLSSWSWVVAVSEGSGYSIEGYGPSLASPCQSFETPVLLTQK